MKSKVLLLTASILFIIYPAVHAQETMNWDQFDNCTSVLVTKSVSTDGSVMTTHSCDGTYEFRIHLIPAKTSAPGTMRPVYKGGGRGREARQAEIVGEIPEVAQTFARFDASYSFMNEKQVAIGETTIGGKRELYNDEGLFDIMALERLALERASTAREAIRIMGEAAATYGYSDGGECLTVIDPNEAWMFEIMGPGPFEAGAVWAARRIPEGEIGVSANRSRITTLDLDDPDHYMASDNIYSVAETMGWWDPDGGKEFVFNEVYANPPRYYNTRREWRVFSILAPSLKLDPWSLDIPFSVKPDNKISPAELMAIHRDSYEGTEFDMTEGLAAGPFGSPNRWATRTRVPEGMIGWERSISIFRCAYCVVLQSRDWLPDWIGGVAWFAEDDPKTSCFVPLYCGITEVPESFEIGGREKFERESAYWAFNFVGNWAELKFSYMIEDIEKAYSTLEEEFFNLQPLVDKRALALYEEKPELARDYLTEYSCSMARNTVDEWWKLGDYLIAKYSDGYINLPSTGRTVGYPEEWLEAVGYGKVRIKK
ncbi:dipeptidase [candidate division KSB1 bacterium]